MLRVPEVYSTKAISKWPTTESVTVDNRDGWILARPTSSVWWSWTHRWKLAWGVLIGRYDALDWSAEACYEYDASESLQACMRSQPIVDMDVVSTSANYNLNLNRSNVGLTNEPPLMFRPYRETFNASMAGVVKIDTITKIVDIIHSMMIATDYEIVSILVQPHPEAIDSRCGWKTHVVLVTTTVTPQFPLGYTSGPVPPELIGL